MATILKDKTGAVIGRILQSDGEFRAYDWMGGYLGKYVTRTDTTYDWVGTRIGTGNLLAMLINS